MKIHYFSQIVVDRGLKDSSLSRHNKDLKILQFFYFLKFLRTKIATFYHNLQEPSMTTAKFGETLLKFEFLSSF